MRTENQTPDTSTTPAQLGTFDELEIANLQADLERRRISLGIDSQTARPGTRLAEACRRFLPPELTPEQLAAEQEREREAKAFAEVRRRHDSWNAVAESIGARYHGCLIANFTISSDPATASLQTAALDKINALAVGLDEHVKRGGNVVLYGPPGTGKDHLLVALIRATIYKHGHDAKWCNGQDLFGLFRDTIDTATTESSMLYRYIAPQVLAISDPVPPKGEASPYAASMLYRLIDGRYRRQRGTWVTVNVTAATDLAAALSSPVADRLRENAVAVFCNWPSFRLRGK